MNQNANYNPYQQLPFSNMYNQNNQNNIQNAYSNPNENRYQGNAPRMNLFNPGNLRATLPNQQISNPDYQNKLSEEEYYSGSLGDNARKGFISKVYLLLSLQLLVTTLIGYISYGNQTFKDIFINTGMVIFVSVALLAVTIVIGCCTQFFRKHALPIFIIFTLLMSLLVAMSICGFQSKIVLMAAGVTLVMTIALTIYAWKAQSDITGYGVYLMILCTVMLVFGIVAIFWKDPIVHLIYSCLGALLFSVYLVYDTQKVVGKGQYSYSLDDTYIAAIQLYMDIIQIFLDLLQILAYFNR